MAMVAGTRFGSCEITAPIGAGGMGEVYRARDTRLERDVAVKLLPESFASDAGRVARLEQEAKTLASLNHANIAQIHGLERSGGTTAIIMELVDGPTLADRIEHGALPADEALAIAMQIAEALEAAHGKGIVHRDLKPANIKLAADGSVKVLDFGIAKAIEPSLAASGGASPVMTTPVTQTGVILGTAAYMSPEQARGKLVDQRTDIWAFGCVLYEMLTGQPAFGGEDVAVTLARVIAEGAHTDTLPATVAPAVRNAIERCLAKDPRKRIADIRDVKLALEGAFETATPPHDVSPPPRRWPWVAAVLVAALAAGTIAWNLRPERSSAVLRFTEILPDGDRFTNIGRPVVTVSPDGSNIVYVANQQLYLRRADAFGATPIAGTDESPSAPFFSPDGQWVGYWSTVDRQLKKISVSGGAPVTLTDAGNPLGAPTWGGDDTIVWGQGGSIMRIAANGGVPEILATDDRLLSNPQMLPDGQTLLFHLGGQGGGEVAVQSLETGERKMLFPGSFPRFVPTGHIVYGEGYVLFAVPFDSAALETLGGPIPVVEDVGSAPMQYAVSAAGTLVYVPDLGGRGGGPRTLAFVDRDGTVERLDVRAASYVMPSVSPDGSHLAVQTLDPDGTGTIWVYDLSGNTQIRQLTQQGNNVRPIWTPDGQRITYASDRDGPRSIYWQAADGRGLPERLTTAEEGSVDAPQSWSGDGRHLSFVRVTGGNTGIATSGGFPRLWALSLDDGAEPQLIHDAASGLSSFSPDGKWIAYESTETGRSEIYVQPFPPTGIVHQITQDGGSDPQWSSSGNELFFMRPDGQLVAIDIATDGPFVFGNERPLPIVRFYTQVTYRNFDVAPDDQRFLVVLPLDESGRDDAMRPQIRVVANWFEELGQRVPVP